MKNSKPTKITIVIISYNNEATIKACLASVFKSDLPNFKKQVIVLDNNSQDGTWEILQEFSAKKELILLKNSFNNGFARAVNQVLTKFNDQDFYFVLNPDAQLAPSALKTLLNHADKNSSLGLLSCRIVEPGRNKLLFQNGAINFFTFKTKHSKAKIGESAYVTGCALLITKKLIADVGIFDPHFFLYYEDADLSRRALKAGFQITTDANAICYHEESHSASSQVKDYFLVRNGLFFFKKHYPLVALPYFWSIFLIRLLYHRYISKKQIVTQAMADFWHA